MGDKRQSYVSPSIAKTFGKEGRKYARGLEISYNISYLRSVFFKSQE